MKELSIQNVRDKCLGEAELIFNDHSISFHFYAFMKLQTKSFPTWN